MQKPQAVEVVAVPVSAARRLAVLADAEMFLTRRRAEAATRGDWRMVARLANDHAAVLHDMADMAQAVGGGE